MIEIFSCKHLSPKFSTVHIIDQTTDWSELDLSEQEITFSKEQVANHNYTHWFNRFGTWTIVVFVKNNNQAYKKREYLRNTGATIAKKSNKLKIDVLNIDNVSNISTAGFDISEGIALGNYNFLDYKTGKRRKQNSLSSLYLSIQSNALTDIQALKIQIDAVYAARNLVNHPLMFLTAEQLSEEIKTLGKASDVKVKVFDKQRIQKEGMGGLLAVNLGSVDPPTFNIMEWKPDNAINEKPYILVGKGVTYDTGGLSLKGTEGSMDHMKCDMAGSAAVIGTMYAVGKNKLPLYVIGLVPATDNRPGGNAYVPGDVIRMHNQMSVEVLNTDAEGRMILADALSYAQSYDPELVIDIATLTGSALMAVGTEAMLLMGTASEENKKAIKQVGYEVHERLVEMPLWEEYGDLIKSDIADIKNVGGRKAGAITAGKFLEHFTNYPWMHIDMAPMGWNYKTQGYRIKGGAGAGVRLLYHFLKSKVKT